MGRTAGMALRHCTRLARSSTRTRLAGRCARHWRAGRVRVVPVRPTGGSGGGPPRAARRCHTIGPSSGAAFCRVVSHCAGLAHRRPDRCSGSHDTNQLCDFGRVYHAHAGMARGRGSRARTTAGTGPPVHRPGRRSGQNGAHVATAGGPRPAPRRGRERADEARRDRARAPVPRARSGSPGQGCRRSDASPGRARRPTGGWAHAERRSRATLAVRVLRVTLEARATIRSVPPEVRHTPGAGR